MTRGSIVFPALAFGEEVERCVIPGVEGLDQLFGPEVFARGTLAANQRRLSWEIVDETGACWKIAESRIVGRPSWLGRAICSLSRKAPTFIFDVRFERLPDSTLERVKARILAAVEGNPVQYVTEAMVESIPQGETIQPEVLVAPICRRVEAAKTFKSAIEALDEEEIVQEESAPGDANNGRSWIFGCFGVVALIVAAFIGWICVRLTAPEGRAEVAGMVIGLTVMTVVFGVGAAVRAWIFEPTRR